MFLFFSVARSQESGSWERAVDTAQSNNGGNSANGTNGGSAPVPKPPPKVVVPKSGINPNFGMNMPMMVSAFDTAVWLELAAA
jgi:hypothetical protein